jgi:hypothetical protein
MTFRLKTLNFIDRFLTSRIKNLSNFLLEIKKYKYFEVFEQREDDIYVITFLKSGTTWMQMILYQMLTDGNMNFHHIYDVSPWITNESIQGKDAEIVNKLPSPRIIKTHDPYKNFDENVKGRFIYVYRDGKDVAISLYNHIKNYNNAEESLDDNFKRFFHTTEEFNFFDFTKDWLENKNNFQILYVDYNELKLDFDNTIIKIADFLKIDSGKLDWERIRERSYFQFMKEHESKFGEQPKDKRIYNEFIRKGEIGEGENLLSDNQKIYFETNYNKHINQLVNHKIRR